MQIKINGTDWTDQFDPYSVCPYHEKVQGPNKGESMAGTTILDTVAVKSGFEITAGLLTQADYTALMALAKQDYVTVVYTDPDTDMDSGPMVMMLTTGKPTQVPLLGGGYMYKNISCNFRER